MTVDLIDRAPHVSPIKQLIRPRQRGKMCSVKTVYGRSITVAADRSFITYECGDFTLKPARDLRVGDVVVASRRLPRPVPQAEVDLAAVLKRAGQDHAVRIEGEAVRRLIAARIAGRQPAELRRDEERVAVPVEAWARLARKRTWKGITCAEMAKRLGYRQACSISEFERCRSRPPVSVFMRYLTELDEPWPDETKLVRSVIDQWAFSPSAHERYRNTSAAVWLSDLDEKDLARLAAEPDGRDVVLYPRAHRDQGLARYLPVTEDLCYVLGWYMAEGSLGSRGSRMNFSLGAGDQPYIPGLCEAVERVTGRAPVVSVPKGRPNSRHVYVHAPLMGRLIRAIGLGEGACEKRVPDLLMNCSEEQQFAFLEGYFLGDGTKDTNGRKIVFSTSSVEMVDGLLYLLGQLGVIAGLYTRRGGTPDPRRRRPHQA
ncbi:LAGLIDADG family homing endonuclease [Actinoallomurus vinaceus]|uniref:LAGLIDADG family homing endonuclease n=1 Tax=Actinoallomurus vinaceus TaxID=1080074 RepID=UPI0031EFF8E6